MAEEFDIGPLTWVKDEIDQALKSVLENFVSFAEKTSDLSPLRFAKTHLYQVSGALDMVGLQGAKRFCEEIDRVVGELESQKLGFSEDVHEKLKQSIQLLSEYLDSLLAGASNQPLKLFPGLQSLASLLSRHVEETELFFPDTTLRAPKDLVTVDIDEAELPSYFVKQRVTFQKALLQWLKNTNPDDLDTIKTVVENVRAAQKQSAQKTLWWVTGAFADALRSSEISENPSVKKLYRQIDQQIKNLSLGNAKAPANLLRDFLYFIAICPLETELTSKVKRTFELNSLIPGAVESVPEEQNFYPELVRLLSPLRSAWSALTINASDQLPYIAGLSEKVVQTSESLANETLVSLTKSVDAAIHWIGEDVSRLSEESIIEVATGLNLLDDAFDLGGEFGPAVAYQLDEQTVRLKKLMAGETFDDVASVYLGKLDNDVLSAVVKQVKDALAVIEKSLDAYFRKPESLDLLEDSKKPLQQVIAAFEMLEMSQPLLITKLSSSVIDLFSNQTKSVESKSPYFDMLAESLSLVGFYIDELPKVREETLAELHKVGQQLESCIATLATDSGNDTTSLTSPEVQIPTTITTVQPVQRAFDAEMLEIFLAEAEEVLANNAQQLQALRVNITDSEALIEVRRGFHTLKGSGRMVGLNSLGDVAWGVEKLLNKLIELKQAPTAKQLSFVEKVSAAFAEWIAELQEHGNVSINAEAWQQEADALEGDTEKQKPVPEEVLIDGTRKMSRTLFNIFMGEAKQHLQVLKQECSALSLVERKKPSNPFIRSAHTLASNAGATGFTPILDLARAFENWLDLHDGHWTPKGLKLADNVVNKLADMLETVENLRQPKRATALLNALKKAIEQAQRDAEDGKIDTASVEADLRFDSQSEHDSESMVSSNADLNAEFSENEIEVSDEIPVFLSVDEPIETPKVIETVDLGESETNYSMSVDLPADDDINAVIDQPEIEGELTSSETTAKQGQGTSSVDQELHTIFIEEAQELVPQIGKALRSWREEPQDVEYPDTLQRVLHTLKGSARMAGQVVMGNTVHGMEDRIIRALQGKVTALDFDGMFADLDSIGQLLDQAMGVSKTEDETVDSDSNAKEITNTAPIPKPAARSSERRSQFLRLRADTLDRLINEAGEISIARARVDQELLGFKQLSTDLTENVNRLRNYLRELEIETESQMQSRLSILQEANETFDPLEFDRFTRLQELARLMAESVNDVSTIQHGLLRNLDETEAALQQQNRMNRELQHGLMDVRMVPFSQISERLQRIVRQTARELKKQATLIIDGEDVDIDRSVLDKIGAPLEHLLRNAVAHGLETTAQRKKAGKTEFGTITLKIRHENDEIALTVSDDGSGVNLKKVRDKAISQGLFTQDQAVSDQVLMSVIFEPGFSTADEVSQISGRGVGLDSVRSDITSLGGRIDVSNSDKQGAVFSIYLPVTLSVSQVVMIRAGSHIYALPSIMVEQLQKLKMGPLVDAYQLGYIEWNSREYPIHFFPKLIGDIQQSPEEQTYTPILLLRSGTYRVALHVDEIMGNQEVVMKPIGPQLSRVPGIAGATVLGDGRIVMIVNPVQLANRESFIAGAVSIHVETPAIVNVNPIALVVDDSLTMRKVLGRLLERENYQVLVAKDGMDALQVLQENQPDIILSDIEMPKMDGFEFVRNVRSDSKFKDTPIIMISSRTAEKHQNHARELGVNAFMGKPVHDDALIEQMSVLLGKSDA